MPEESGFDVALEPGLNMISIPLMPAEPYTAKSLADMLGSTIVIKLDATTQNFVGYTVAEGDDGFAIDGGRGYIVNTPAGGVVTFTGKAWSNPTTEEPAEEPAEEPTEAPAEEPAAEEPVVAEEPAAEEPAEEPAAEEPAAEEPVVAEEPAAEAPAEEPVVAEEPAAEAPAEEPVVAEEPAETPVEEPAADAPAEEPVVAEEPAAEAPAEEAEAEAPAEEAEAEAPAEEENGEEEAAEAPAPAEEAAPAAPALSTYKSAWAFIVTSDLQGMEPGASYTVVAENLRTGTIASQRVNSDAKRSSAVWADMNRKSVVEAGDKVEITLHDERGAIVSGPFQRTVTTADIRNAFLTLQLRVGDVQPKDTILAQNFPNPFNPETWIPYQLNKATEVTIHIYDSSGRLVRTLNLGWQPTGSYMTASSAAYWDGRNEVGERVASGIYFYTLQTQDFTATRKMVILK